MEKSATIPLRSEVDSGQRWNLSRLFPDEAAWEEGLKQFETMKGGIAAFRGNLGKDPESFLGALAYYCNSGLLDERLGYYAHLRVSEDEGDNAARSRFSRYMMATTAFQGEWSWFGPEIQSLPDSFIASCLGDPRFAEYRVFISKLIRFKPHILSASEERLLALQAECNQTPSETFSVLTNVDIDFGTVEMPEGGKPLTQSTFASFMRNPDREIRKKAYLQFYSSYESHKNTIASLYSGTVKQDKYSATVRNYSGARAQALFPDKVPESVYDNLVSTVSANLGPLHEYYGLRKRVMKLDELRHYDVYVPIMREKSSRHSFGEAVDIVSEALAPLGAEYVSTLRAGLTGGWVDRYENKGKRSGAFSAGSFAGDPYILMNYKEDVLRDVFTLAHEGGHSMHSWYSARSNPFLSYNYTIFEAEVASTFNEQLVFKYLYEGAQDKAERAALINNKVDDLLATLFRQTMFAEFEHRTHAMMEAGEALTVDSLRSEYRALLVKYFGPAMVLEAVSDLEGLRIPHFYNAFYVYKYATGISASIALSKRVLEGGENERADYFAFLRSGGSRFPIESLKVAGVDMSTPEPIEAACGEFAANVRELSALLGV